jgi:UDP-glucuronate 4-epimerase
MFLKRFIRETFLGEINLNVLVTGSAGFIGSALVLKLLEQGQTVVGIDNHNDYYDTSIKEARLKRLINYQNYLHFRVDLADKEGMNSIFQQYKPDKVVNLAAQAGVRYSIDNPSAYIHSNILGFANILECCRHNSVGHLVYASSSSVYGANQLAPFSVNHNVDHPLSLYAASKKSNELMAHTYSHLFGLPTTGLRFFTVYGPWGRPDMALFKFTKAILAGEKIQLFNYGLHKRDFTFIDDVVNGIICTLASPAISNVNWDSKAPDPASSSSPWKVYNLGNNSPVELYDFITSIEDALGLKAQIELLPLQAGDVIDTYADVTDFERDFSYKPATTIQDGVKKFVDWYREYYQI